MHSNHIDRDRNAQMNDRDDKMLSVATTVLLFCIYSSVVLFVLFLLFSMSYDANTKQLVCETCFTNASISNATYCLN